MNYPKINSEELFILSSVAEKLGTNPDWLYKLIDFESGWKPGAKNPYSGARGLIQFTDTTARSMGYKGADDLLQKNSSISDQLLSPVYEYLKKYAPLGTEQKLTMAVFYPAYRTVDSATAFPLNVQAVNPGIKTPLDYMRRVFGSGWSPPGVGAVIALLIIGGVILFNYLQKG